MNQSARLEKSVSVDTALKALGSIVLAVTIPLLTWTVVQVVDLKERMAAAEAHSVSNRALLQDIKVDINDIRILLIQAIKENGKK